MLAGQQVDNQAVEDLQAWLERQFESLKLRLHSNTRSVWLQNLQSLCPFPRPMEVIHGT